MEVFCVDIRESFKGQLNIRCKYNGHTIQVNLHRVPTKIIVVPNMEATREAVEDEMRKMGKCIFRWESKSAITHGNVFKPSQQIDLLAVSILANERPIPGKGKWYSNVIKCDDSIVNLFCIERGIKGPGWIKIEGCHYSSSSGEYMGDADKVVISQCIHATPPPRLSLLSFNKEGETVFCSSVDIESAAFEVTQRGRFSELIKLDPDVIIGYGIRDGFKTDKKNGALILDVHRAAREYAKDIQDCSLKALCEAMNVDETLHEAVRILEVMSKLDILPLSYNLSRVCCAPWRVTLEGGIAERTELLMSHRFHERGVIIPERRARGKIPYEGGLVLEPKVGLYRTYVILLDFNSLYPSIIREYGMCFSPEIKSKTKLRPSPLITDDDDNKTSDTPRSRRGSRRREKNGTGAGKRRARRAKAKTVY